MTKAEFTTNFPQRDPLGITVVMPCLNEEANVRQAMDSTLQAFDAYKLDGELIVVNDGSNDGTRAVVEERARLDFRIRLLNHDRPLGIGRSFFDGVQQAGKEFVTMFPGDNENDPMDALTYINIARDVDIIVPFIHNVEIRSRMRRLTSALYRLIINLSFGMNLNYTNGTVIYNTMMLRGIKPRAQGFFYQAEILIRLIRQGYLYAETPHFLADRSSGKTKALSLKSLRDVSLAYLHLMADVHLFRRVGATDQPLHPASATMRRVSEYSSAGPATSPQDGATIVPVTTRRELLDETVDG